MTGISKGETICVNQHVDGKLKYLITRDKNNTIFYLYEVIDGQAVKSKYKSENPLSFDEWIK